MEQKKMYKKEIIEGKMKVKKKNWKKQGVREIKKSTPKAFTRTYYIGNIEKQKRLVLSCACQTWLSRTKLILGENE